MKHLLLICLSFSISSSCFSQAGLLDQSFGDAGIKLLDTKGLCHAIALQADGKILLGGGGDNGPASLVIRLLPDGSIDSSFGNEGFVTLLVSEFGYGEVRDLKVQSDGKIMATSSAANKTFLLRLKENGSLDSSFATNGTAILSFTLWTTFLALEIQPDGKYVLAGFNSDDNLNQDVVVFRCNPDGGIDESFGDKGQVIISQDNAKTANALTLQTDGKIVLGGAAGGGGNAFFLARLNIDGSLDSSFSGNGTIYTVLDGQAYINSVALQTDEKIVAAGSSRIMVGQATEALTVVRYESNGSIDFTFAKEGKAIIEFPGRRSQARSVLIQQDRKIICAGQISDLVYDSIDVAMTRLRKDGSLDSTFAINGRLTTDMQGDEGQRDAALQQDGKILLAGDSYITGQSYFFVARYNNDAVMPLHFTYFNAAPTNNGGITLNWQTAQENNNSYFSIQRSANNNFNEIARVNSNGNSSQAQTYSYTDNAPLQGTNFYRLKQVDKDGKFSYSQVVSATVANGLTVVLYPNPVRDVLNIKGLDATMSYELSVMSAKGSVVAKTSVSNVSSYQWDLKSLSK